MKIRNGFVSNSSSSSFIVFYSKKPESIMDIENEFKIGDNEIFESEYCDYSEEHTKLHYATILFDDLVQDEKQNKKEVIEQLSNQIYCCSTSGYSQKIKKYGMYWYDNLLLHDDSKEIEGKMLYFKKLTLLGDKLYNDKPKFSAIEYTENSDKLYSEENKVKKELAEILLQKLIKKHRNKYPAYYRYSDSDSETREIERGEVFRWGEIDHIRYSEH